MQPGVTRRRFGRAAAAGLISAACIEDTSTRAHAAPVPGDTPPVPSSTPASPAGRSASASSVAVAFEPIVPRAELVARRPIEIGAHPTLSGWIERVPALRELQIAALVYESAGVKVDAYLVAPAEARAAPTVLYARGGGAKNEVNPFIIATHLAPLAAAGFCVVATQYRKAPRGHDEFGGAEVADLVNAAALLDQLPEADPARVGLVGWSRGAMMVHLALAHAPSAFRAAVCAAGVADQFAELERRPAMEEVLAEQIPGFAEHRDRELTRRSPLLWAEQLPRDVPILLLHGGADWRVSAHESLKLAARFLDLAQPHRMVLYEGAAHGIGEFSDDVLGQITRWFERYLDPTTPLPDMTPHGR